MDRLGGFLGGSAGDDPAVDRRAVGGRAVGSCSRPGGVPSARQERRFSLLRWGPMAVADLVAEWFETDLLQASVAARAISSAPHGSVVGGHGRRSAARTPRSDPAPGGSSVAGRRRSRRGHARHGATPRSKPVPRFAPAPTWSASWSRTARFAASCSPTAPSSPPTAVVSAVDPRRTFLGLIDPMDLDPDSSRASGTTACPGTVAKVNVALSGLPVFRGLKDTSAGCSSRTRDRRARHRLPRARLRRFEVRRDLAGTLSRHHVPLGPRRDRWRRRDVM